MVPVLITIVFPTLRLSPLGSGLGLSGKDRDVLYDPETPIDFTNLSVPPARVPWMGRLGLNMQHQAKIK